MELYLIHKVSHKHICIYTITGVTNKVEKKTTLSGCNLIKGGSQLSGHSFFALLAKVIVNKKEAL